MNISKVYEWYTKNNTIRSDALCVLKKLCHLVKTDPCGLALIANSQQCNRELLQRADYTCATQRF